MPPLVPSIAAWATAGRMEYDELDVAHYDVVSVSVVIEQTVIANERDAMKNSSERHIIQTND